MLIRRQPLAGWAVRPAGSADAQALARLCAAHASFERIPCQHEGHADRLADALNAGRLHAWLVWLDGDAVGYSSATLDFFTLAGAPFLHLDCLYLDPAARGRGLGRELLAAVGDRARALGCTEVQWQTPVWNADAIRFYDRLGAIRQEKHRYTMALRVRENGAGEAERRRGVVHHQCNHLALSTQ
jgi:GNAT superfamily N-acetyltransferase